MSPDHVFGTSFREFLISTNVTSILNALFISHFLTYSFCSVRLSEPSNVVASSTVHRETATHGSVLFRTDTHSYSFLSKVCAVIVVRVVPVSIENDNFVGAVPRELPVNQLT